MLEYFRELGDLGGSSKIISGSTRKFFYEVWEIWALFSGRKGTLAPTRRASLLMLHS